MTSAFVAQPLAARDIVVLQLDMDISEESTPGEARAEASAYEGAIDYLDRLGVIDRDRAGIIGFSRTGLFVKYLLTSSLYHFAAATVAAPSDEGYFYYVAVLNFLPWQAADAEQVNQGIPFGSGMASWLKNSPNFNLTKVTTPVRLECSPDELLTQWEWFAGLLRLRKPVDFIYTPDADHVLVKPWNRMTSQEGNVDWFCFWLKGEEDPDPAKADQYVRWRELRKLQQQNEKNSPAPSPN